ncbi:hypothetical protein [Owenweeksia hongkongensis]|uniref:hypothetical protein n=1 Tax=Owenweeksia hongkongensis TaxID=253245 RepID=UPI003A90B1E6
MKTYRKIKFGFLAVVVCVSSALSGQNNDKAIMEAANKGKQDLMEVLKSGRDINLGVSADELGSAQAGTPVAHQVLSFDRLTKADSTSRLADMVDKEASATSIVPLMNGGSVVTVITVANMKGEYKVVGLGGMTFANDLNTVMKASGSKRITAYEVPNLQTVIYAVNQQGKEMYYTNFEGNSLQRPVTVALLLPAVQKAAARFQKEYGAALQKGELVK